MKSILFVFVALTFSLFPLISFSETSNTQNTNEVVPTAIEENDIYQFANRCWSIQLEQAGKFLGKTNDGYMFAVGRNLKPSSFILRPSALGIYLLYDQDEQYLIAKDQGLEFTDHLESEMQLQIPERNYLTTPGEWQLFPAKESGKYHFQQTKSQSWLAKEGLSNDINDAASLSFIKSEECSEFPEAYTAASGSITKTQHEDGSLWGFVDAHEHLGANHGFGGRAFHGAAFHKLGIEHALADCEKHHGTGGSKDLLGIMYKSGSGNVSGQTFIGEVFDHVVLGKKDHSTNGYPNLEEWVVHKTPTHQSLYYKWIERAYLGGMRLMVEYMESTEVVCNVFASYIPGEDYAENCNEMTHVDHQLLKLNELEDYIDAQAGGPGKGWFRLVFSPEEAREVIKAGKLAVIIGIEIENPLDCFLDERDGFETCTDEIVKERLQEYYDKGVRALFPSHKFVNAFSSGDGNPGILELGDYRNSGLWRQYAACKDVPGEYWMKSHAEGKKASIFKSLSSIPGLNTLNELLSDDGKGKALPIYPPAESHCQIDGFTPLGLTLIDEMMSLGMIIDLGHTPKPALNQIMPILKENNYPAVHTHGGDQNAMNEINGLSTRGLGSACRDDEGESSLQKTFEEIFAQIDPTNGMPRKGLSYDFNGLAGYNKPRFGELSRCETEQSDPLEYPFKSFAGDITFNKSSAGNKTYDFNTDGLANIGLYPELIEEAKRSGAKEEEINALFKTAESYIRIWEQAESFNKTKN